MTPRHYDKPSLFEPANLLREARRQRNLPEARVPDVCALDPDGDLARHLARTGARPNPAWACYHSDMFDLAVEGTTVGVVGCAVGAPYAVLVAEQLFASGCRALVSVTSAGQLVPAGVPPYFVLIDRALRDEGTSAHYRPPAPYARLRTELEPMAAHVLGHMDHVVRGGSWTTDAPFRETEEAISFAKAEGLLAVEMEAAALYAFAEARHRTVICFAHVTNRMATVENDFEKGEADGNAEFIRLLAAAIHAWRATA